MTLSRLNSLELLFSSSAHERGRAARALYKTATDEDLAAIKKARFLEKDSYVIGALDRVLLRNASSKKDQPPVKPVKSELIEIIRNERTQAIDWISGLLLHEIGAKIGLVELYAQKEIPNYFCSDTKKKINHLQQIFEGIENLRSASAAPKITEFSLSNLIDDIIDIEIEGKEVAISRIGERPAIALSDPALLRLAISNGVRNGIEAVLSAPRMATEADDLGTVNRPTDVIVSWGVTDTDYWLTVIDHGQGLSAGKGIFEVGISTKKGHAGFGLPIAKQAIDSINGAIRLFQSPGGGATYELRWDKII